MDSKDCMRPKLLKWKFNFADDLELSESKVNDSIIPTEEVLEEGEIDE